MSDITAKKYSRALTVAGSDSGGGAGIQADLKTFAALGCYGASAVTAVTAQNTLGVTAVHPVPVPVLEAQLRAVLDDIGADAVKIGMLHSAALIEAVAGLLEEYSVKRVVLDPVMVATSGDRLMQAEAVEILKDLLLPAATLLTPNIPEAELLLGRAISSEDQLPEAARELCSLGPRAVLLKAGHLDGPELIDYCYDSETGRLQALPSTRIDTPNTHGTGCTLSSAVAAHLARGASLEEAVRGGKAYLAEAINRGSGYALGSGHGPVHHFHAHWGGL